MPATPRLAIGAQSKRCDSDAIIAVYLFLLRHLAATIVNPLLTPRLTIHLFRAH